MFVALTPALVFHDHSETWQRGCGSYYWGGLGREEAEGFDGDPWFTAACQWGTSWAQARSPEPEHLGRGSSAWR